MLFFALQRGTSSMDDAPLFLFQKNICIYVLTYTVVSANICIDEHESRNGKRFKNEKLRSK